MSRYIDISIYKYKFSVSAFWNKPNKYGRCDLGINGEGLGSYASPLLAADDVFCHAPGYDDWDLNDSLEGPADIFEWIYYPNLNS